VEDVIVAAEEAGDAIATILADGGPTTNAALMQLQADTSGRDVVTSQVAELSALGAAHVAGVGAGLWSLDALEQLPRDGTVFRARTTADQRAEGRRGWHTAVSSALGTPDLTPTQQAPTSTPPPATEHP
jgi:glycerol kinase